MFLKKCTCTFVNFDQAAALLRLSRLFRRGIRDFGHGDAEFFGDHAHGFGKSYVLDLLHEAEDVASGVAAEAVEELIAGMNGERRSFFLVEGTQSLIILRATFA